MVLGGITVHCDKCGLDYCFNTDFTDSVQDAIDEIIGYGWTVPEVENPGPLLGTTCFDCYCPDCSEMMKSEEEDE